MGIPRILQIDEKWSIEYDPCDNDRPKNLLRYGESSIIDIKSQPNYVSAMFYRLLELSDET